MLTMLTMLTTPPRVRANAYHVLTTPPRVFREPKMCLRNIWTAPKRKYASRETGDYQPSVSRYLKSDIEC